MLPDINRPYKVYTNVFKTIGMKYEYFEKQCRSWEVITIPQAETACEKIMAYYTSLHFFFLFPDAPKIIE